ncbi:MAG: HAMP domain-containing sensor histidine kinase [Nocardioides sp.]|uniref:sensor histidine kinase n=1 Tax=Nocardioides sp. TaxID=35761 RepID=UPI0039E5B534
MRSLTGRLVATVVALVALVSLLVVGLTTVAMQSYLAHRLDEQVLQSRVAPPHQLDLTNGQGSGPDDGGPGGATGPEDQNRYGALGTLSAFLPVSGTADAVGSVITGDDDGTDLTAADLAALDDVPVDEKVHVVDLPDAGEYHVVAHKLIGQSGSQVGRMVAGLPTSEITRTLNSLLTRGVAVAALGVALTAGLGLALVRRQLRPLREVAATAHRVSEIPLAEGEINLTERVPEHLTDERTEVGQVGAALNTLLSHVETSLDARHRSEQQVRQFVADASHELRTPLATIMGYTELAQRRPDDAAGTQTALSKVGAESERMAALVQDLLLLARLDAGRPLERHPVDLSRLLIEAVSDARVLAPDHEWRLDLPEEAVEVVGDEQRLHQVVTNLLTNERRHTPAGTTITVAARLGEITGQITVHDDGPGFPAELVDQAFERFARADTARSRTGEGGVGLGLSLVKAIVTAHGGDVTLTSRPGDTTITLTLPAG